MKQLYRNLSELMKRDKDTKRKLKSMLVLGCSVSLFVILFIGAVGLYFMKPMLGFIFANVPILNDILFTQMRNVVLPYLREDILGIVTGVINNANVAELKAIVNNYFDQLGTVKNIGFDSFIAFTDKVKQIMTDGQITQNELDLLRKYVSY